MRAALILLAVGFAFAQDDDPDFEWLQEVGAFGIPLLKVSYPNGESDVAILRATNPISNRKDKGCIFNGFLEKENSLVTLTGCPMEGDFSVQFDSHLLKNDAFKVVNGRVFAIPQTNKSIMKSSGRAGNYVGCNGVQDTRDFKLSQNGYVMRVRALYDQNWQDKFKRDAEVAIQRIWAHTQHILKWPSLGTKIYLNPDKDMQPIEGRYYANMSLATIAPKYAKDKSVHAYTFFAIRAPNADYDTLGKAYTGGACSSSVALHSAFMEYEDDDIAFARSLAHELVHTLGADHDFCNKDEDSIRIDSKGNSCSKNGTMMGYEKEHDGDKRQWSTCTVEDIGRLVQDNPTCFKEYDPKNPPPALSQIPLTENECDLRKAKGDLVGYVQLKLNGIKCMALCIDGICAPTDKCKATGNGCERLCGKRQCDAAVDL